MTATVVSGWHGYVDCAWEVVSLIFDRVALKPLMCPGGVTFPPVGCFCELVNQKYSIIRFLNVDVRLVQNRVSVISQTLFLALKCIWHLQWNIELRQINQSILTVLDAEHAWHIYTHTGCRATNTTYKTKYHTRDLILSTCKCYLEFKSKGSMY